MYINAFDRMIKEREKKGKETKWKTGEDVFYWWMDDDINQIKFNLENENIEW